MPNPVGQTTQIQLLLTALASGDSKAGGDLITYCCDRLRRLAGKMLKGYPRLRRWEQTDDVLQVALLRLHRALSEVKPESPRQFFGLAATQIRRTLIDLARHHFGPEGAARHHQTDGPSRDKEGRNHGAEPAAPSIEPETLEAWAAFHSAIERLPDEEKEVVGLLWYEGMSQTEAAALLGVTDRTIRRRWQAARVMLYEHLRDQQPA